MKTIEELETYAKEHYIPIARRDMVSFLIQTVKENNYKDVLEVGAAIGYSTIQLAMLPGVYVDTFEYWMPRYVVCVQNIKDFNLEDKINLSRFDVMEVPIEKKYDLIFIDGAKAKTIQLFEYLKDSVKDDGLIIIDNIDLEVVDKIEISKEKRRYQRVVEETQEYFKSVPGFIVEYLPIGDGIYRIRKDIK